MWQSASLTRSCWSFACRSISLQNRLSARQADTASVSGAPEATRVLASRATNSDEKSRGMALTVACIV